MLICEDCGNTIENNELGYHKERMGECHGTIAYDTVVDTCSCGGAYVPAKECFLCGEWISKSASNICNKCLEKNSNFDNAIDYGLRNKDYIKLNGLYCEIFSEEEIEHILFTVINNALILNIGNYNKKIKDYCLSDDWSFSDYLEINNKKGESNVK